MPFLAAIPAGYFAAAGLALSAAGTAYSMHQQNKQGKLAEKAADQANNLAELENRKARIRAVRDARIKRANMMAQGQAAGAQFSSGVAGGTSSIGSQLGSNIGFQQTRTGVSQNIANLQNQGQQAANKGQIGSAFAGIGDTIFSDFGGYKSLFK